MIPDSKVPAANMDPVWGRQDPGVPHAGQINFSIWDGTWMAHTYVAWSRCMDEIYLGTMIECIHITSSDRKKLYLDMQT